MILYFSLSFIWDFLKVKHHKPPNVFILWTQVDPYLQLIEDHKLQAVSFAPDNLSINYGSKEDDDRALDMLSDLLTYIHKTRDLFASEIIKSLEMFAKVMLLLLCFGLSGDKKIIAFLDIMKLCLLYRRNYHQ